MSSSSKKVRTLQDQASFYLEPVVPGNPRQFWQTMNPERMKQKCFEFLRSDNVNQATKDKLVAVIEQL